MKTILNDNNYLYHFEEENIYLMFNHRFALWSWLNEINLENFGKFTLVHIDTHHDCGEVCFGKEQLITKNNFSKFKSINFFKQSKCEGVKDLELFNCGSFLGTALKSNLFQKIHFFVRSDNTSSASKNIFNNINPRSSYKTKIEYTEKENFENLKRVLKSNKNIFLDLDLDYFTDDLSDKNKIFKEKKMIGYFKLIKDNISNIKVITVAETDHVYVEVKIKFLKYFGLWDDFRHK